LQLVRVDVDGAQRSAPMAGAWELVTARGCLRVHEGIGVGELRIVLETLVHKEPAP